jgi:hypothetical protein
MAATYDEGSVSNSYKGDEMSILHRIATCSTIEMEYYGGQRCRDNELDDYNKKARHYRFHKITGDGGETVNIPASRREFSGE